MKALADAVVYAVVFIDLWDDRDTEFLDDDVGALESIAGYLQDASRAEQDALAEAAERALREEKASDRSRRKFINAYKNWMEEMFGDEEWDGNKRRPKS
jgi:hypothetical protein